MGTHHHHHGASSVMSTRHWSSSSRCLFYMTFSVLLIVQAVLWGFYLTRSCDHQADERTILLKVDKSLLMMNQQTDNHHVLRDLDDDKTNTEPPKVKPPEYYNGAGAAAENSREQGKNMMKTWMAMDEKASDNDDGKDINGNQPLEGSNIKILQESMENKNVSMQQFKKTPVVDLKKVNLTKGSIGVFLQGVSRRLKNDVPKMVPKPGFVFHETRRDFTVLTSTNAAFLDFTENWLLSLHQIGIQYSISIIAEDALAYDYLTARYFNADNIHVYKTSNNESSTKALQFVSAEYTSLVNRRAEYMLHFLKQDIDVLAVDVDAYWFRDPMEVIRGGFDVYDVWVSVGADEKRPCPCFMYLKAKPMVIKMVNDWSRRMQRLEGKENDQEALGQMLWKYKAMPLHHGLRVNAAHLDPNLFPTGEVFFRPTWWWEHGKRVYVAHANRIGNHLKKVAMFREYKLWLIEPYDIEFSESAPGGQPVV